MTLETREKETKTASPLAPPPPRGGDDVVKPYQQGTQSRTQSGTQAAKETGDVGSMGTGGSMGATTASSSTGKVGSMGTGDAGGDAKQQAGGMHDEDKQNVAKQGEAKEQNVVRDRSGKVVLGMDGKPITYGGDGQLTNVQLYELLNQRQELTPEEKKKEKRRKIFAAIGDGISALSNLYFTTKGAPSMYSGKQTLSQKETDYWDKLRQDRKNERRRYVDGYLKALQADSLAAIRKQNADTQQAAKEAEAKRKEAEAKRKDDLAEAQGEVYRARAAKDAAATAMAEKTLEYMNAYGWSLKRAKAQAGIDLAKARTTQAEASADKATASAAKTRASAGSGGSGSKKYYGTFNGVAYRTKADYDKAVVDYAKGNKIPITYDKASTDKYGRKRTTQTNRSIAGLATDGEADYRAKQAERARAAQKPAAQTKAAPKAKPAAPAKKTYTHTKSLGL